MPRIDFSCTPNLKLIPVRATNLLGSLYVLQINILPRLLPKPLAIPIFANFSTGRGSVRVIDGCKKHTTLFFRSIFLSGGGSIFELGLADTYY